MSFYYNFYYKRRKEPAVHHIDPTVRRETAHIALWTAIFILPVQAIFFLLRQWDYTVLLGSILGSVTAVGNFLLVGLMVQKAVKQDEKAARNTVRASQGGRLLLQGVMLIIAAVLPCFNIWAAAVPLFVPRIAVTVQARRTSKNEPDNDIT
jgi:hypothetical protein